MDTVSRQQRVCEYRDCDVEFEPATHNQVYHTEECCRLETNARMKERYRENRDRRNGAVRICKTPGCGTKLSRYNESKYCSKCETAPEVQTNKQLLELLGYGSK
jgi:hypothetical protein